MARPTSMKQIVMILVCDPQTRERALQINALLDPMPGPTNLLGCATLKTDIGYESQARVAAICDCDEACSSYRRT